MNDENLENDNNDKGYDTNESVNREKSLCLNCSHPISKEDKYCPTCGQKNIDGRITFRQFLADFFEAVFNLDSRLFKTIPALLIPGKLTRVYFSGKHNTYFKPLRLFFTTMIVFYAVLGFLYLNKLENTLDKVNPGQQLSYAQYIDTVVAHIGYDTMTLEQQFVVDTIVSRAHAPFDNLVQDKQVDDSLNRLTIWLQDTSDIAVRDLYTLSADSIFKKYNIEGFVKRTTVRQTIAVTRHPGKVLRFIIGNTTWMILVMLPVVAGFMQLMYVRRKTFFIEHLIFLYHYHAAAFLVMTIYLLLLPLLSSFFEWVVPLSLAVFFLVAMKVYYHQGWLKTIFKFGLLGIAYIVLLSIFGGLTSVISFFIYQ